MIKGLPEKLKTLRLRSGLSQRAVARQLGASPSIISGYETGERTPSAENLLALSFLYKCSVDYLLGRDAAPPPVVLDTRGLSERQIQLLTELIGTMRGPEAEKKPGGAAGSAPKGEN